MRYFISPLGAVIVLVILGMVLAVSCDRAEARRHGGALVLADGTQVFCDKGRITSCGLRLWDCRDGKHYYCQTNVQRR